MALHDSQIHKRVLNNFNYLHCILSIIKLTWPRQNNQDHKFSNFHKLKSVLIFSFCSSSLIYL